MKKSKAIGMLLSLMLSLLVLRPSISRAYTYSLPLNSPLLLGSQYYPGIQCAFSSASIDFCTSTSCPSTPHQLSVMTHCDPDGAGSLSSDKTGLYVTDGSTIVDVSTLTPSSPYWTWQSGSPGSPYGCVIGTDVVIGNGSSLSDFKIGVIYSYTTLTGGSVALDIYDVSNPGGTLTVTYSNTITLSTTSDMGARIDIIADYNNILSTGKPKCDRFVATWYDVTAGGNVGYSATLSNPSTATTAYFNNVYADWTTSDVAGIQRTHPKINDNVALFTYSDGSTLRYQEWNISSGVVSAPVMLGSAGSTDVSPRIDAIDDPALQATGNNNWLVAAMESSGMLIDVYSDTYPAGLGSIPVSYGLSTGGCPVTVGPGSQYTIGFYDLTSGSFRTNYVDFSGAYVNVVKAGGYDVDNTSSTSYYIDDVTLSGTCNTTGEFIFAGWRNVNSTGYHDYYYKTTNLPIGFKQPSTFANTLPEKFTISPNPTQNIVTLTGKHGDGDTYSVIDLAGKTIMMGKIIADEQILDVNNLTNGVYILNVVTSSKSQRFEFVKD